MERLITPGIFLLAFGLRVFLLDAQSIWWDEAFSIQISSLDLGQITSLMDIHPPGYHYLLPLWMALTGWGAFATRFLSVLLGVVAVALAGRLGRELFGRRAGLWAAFLAALSPFWVAYSQEVRMYSLILALSLTSVILWYRLVQKGQGGVGAWAGLVAVNGVALYTHYSTAFVLAFEGVFLLLRCLWPTRGKVAWGPLVRGLAALGGATLLYLPWLGISLGQVAEYVYPGLVAPPLLSGVVELWHGFVLGGFAPLGQAWPYLAVVASMLVVGVALTWRQRRPRAGYPGAIAYGSLYLAIPFVAFLMVMSFRPFFHPRYLMVGSPGVFLLLGLALASLRRWLALPLAGAIAVASLWGLHNYYFDPTYAKDDGRGVVRFLEAAAQKDDLILWETPLPFVYYYRGPAPAHYFRPSLEEGAAELTRLAQGKRRVFWVTWIHARLDLWGLTKFLLEKHGWQAGLRHFRGHDVFWYEVAPDTVFSWGEIKPTFVDFGGQVALTGAAFGGQGDSGAAESGGLAWVTLRWKGLRPGEQPLKYYAYLRDETGVVVSQADRLLYNAGRYAPISREREALTGADLLTLQTLHAAQPVTTPYWTEGEETLAFALLPVPPGSPPGEYELEVGIYEADTQQRIGAVGALSLPVVGHLQVTPPTTPPFLSDLAITQAVGQSAYGGGGLELLGFDPPQVTSAGPGDMVAVTFYWKAAAPVAEGEPSVALLLKDEAGRVFGRQEAVPLEGRHPPSQWREGDTFWERRRFTIPAETPPGDYHLTLQGEGMELVLAQLQITERERSFTVPPMRNSVGASFEEGIELLGFDLEPRDGLRPGQSLRLTLHWRASGPVANRYTVFTHLLDAANQVRAQHDSPPQMGRSPTTSWVAGQVVSDEHLISLPKEMPPGRYELEVGLYDPLSGQRLLLESGQGRVVLGWVEVVG